MENHSYWKTFRKQFSKHRLGSIASSIIVLFVIVGIYAPFLASSKPLAVYFDGSWYFPLFRYLFYPGFFSKKIDIFYNLLMFTAPAAILAAIFAKAYKDRWKEILIAFLAVQSLLFISLLLSPPKDPAIDSDLLLQRIETNKKNALPNWNQDLNFMTPY
jgi:peptide/nickel transport system permease protein